MISTLNTANLVAGGLALISAFMFAIAFVVQQRAAQDVPDHAARGIRLILRLIRRPMWWAGAGSDTAGYALQATALWLGAVLLVEPLLVTSMLFALPLGARWAGRRLRYSDWIAAVALAVALAAFILLGTPTQGLTRAPWRSWVWPAIALISIIAGCLTAAALLRRTPRALLLGLVAGVLYGVTAVLTKSVTNLFGSGLLTVSTAWETYALVVVVIGGTVVQQSAFQAGSLSASLPSLTVMEPVVATLLGVVVLKERLLASGPEWLFIAVSVAVMAAGTIALARSAARAQTAAEANGSGSLDGATLR